MSAPKPLQVPPWDESDQDAKIPASNQSTANNNMAFKSQPLYYNSHPNNKAEKVPHWVEENHNGCKFIRMAFYTTFWGESTSF